MINIPYEYQINSSYPYTYKLSIDIGLINSGDKAAPKSADVFPSDTIWYINLPVSF